VISQAFFSFKPTTPEMEKGARKKKDRHHGNGEEMRRVDLHVLQ